MELIRDTPFGIRWGIRELLPTLPQLQIVVSASFVLGEGGEYALAEEQPEPAEAEMRPPGARTSCVLLGPFAQSGRLQIGGSTEASARVPMALQLGELLVGEESLEVEGLRADPAPIRAVLPGRRARAFLVGEGEPKLREVPLRLDHLQLEVSDGRLRLTWRGSLPLREGAQPDRLFLLDEAISPPEGGRVRYEEWLARVLEGESLREGEPEAEAEVRDPGKLRAPLLDLSDELRKAELEKFIERVKGIAVDEGATTLILEGVGPAPVPAQEEGRSLSEEMPTLIAQEGAITQQAIAALARASGEAAALASTEAPERWSSEHRQQVITAALEGRSCAGLDLRRADLSELDLSELDLRGADLRGANLHDTVLDRAVLEDAKLDGAVLEGCQLQEAHCARARFVGVLGAGADMSRADLSAVDMTGADLRGAVIRSALLVGACMRAVSAPKAILDYSDLSGVQAAGAIFREASLVRTRLVGAALAGSDLTGASLEGALYEDRQG